MKQAFRFSILALTLALSACATPGAPGNDAIVVKADSPNGGANEATLIAASHGRVQRSGDDLILRFANGRVMTFHNDDKGCEDGLDHCDGFVLAADLPQFHWLLVNERLYEGENLFLFDDQTGGRTQIPFWPVFSPDGQRMLFLNDDVSDSFPGDNLEIWRREGTRAVREWADNPSESDTGVPPDFGPYHAEVQNWRGDHISLIFSTHDIFNTRTRQTISGRKWTATLTHGTDGWRLNARAPK